MAETASPPRPEAGKKGTDEDRVRIVLTGLDKTAEAFGREAAHEKRSKNPEGPAWKRVVKSAWNNLTHEYQIVRDTQKYTEEAYENDNFLHHYGESDKAWREATQERYASDYAEELLRDGETFHKLHELDKEHANHMQEDIIALVANRAKGIIPDEDSFNAALERIANDWKEKGISQEYIGEGRMLGHNMDKMAMQVKAMADAISGLSAAERNTKIDDILSNADVIVGEAKAGPETEIEATTAERIAAKMQKVPFLNEGRFAKIASAVTNETFVAGTISAATYGASRLTSMVTTGLGGATVAALRERSALKAERALAERRRFMGAEATDMPDNSADSKAKRLLKKAGVGISEEQRRAEIEETLYNAIPADEVIANIGSFYSDEGDLMITNADKLKEAFDVLGRAKARADRKLLSVSDVEVAEKATRLFEAQVAIAKLQADIKKMYGDDIARSVLDVQEDEFDGHLAQAVSAEAGIIGQETLEADKLMRKLMRTRMFQRGIMGLAIGYGAGEVMHGLVGMMGGGGNNHAPENVGNNQAPSDVGGNRAPSDVGGGNHAPDDVDGNRAPSDVGGENKAPSDVGEGGSRAPEDVGDGNRAPQDVGTGESGTRAPEDVGDGNKAPSDVGGENKAPSDVGDNRAPEDVGEGNKAPSDVGGENRAPSEVDGGDSGDTVTSELSDRSEVTMPDGYKANVSGDQLTITTPDGKTFENLPLNKDGSLTVEAQDKLRAGGLKISEHVNIVQGDPEVSKVEVSPNEFVANHKDDMATIGHREWVNGPDEFRLQNHLNADGSVTIDISGMQGSAWQAAAENGHMNVYLGASTGSSGHGFKVPIGPDGKATIPADSPMRSLFDANGNFQGGYQEAAVTGDTVNGADHIAVLATATGENQDTLIDSVTSQEPYATHDYTITAPEGATINPDLAAFVTGLGEAGAAAPIYTMTSRKGIGQTGRRTTPSVATGTGASSATGPSSTSSSSTGPGAAGAGPDSGPNPDSSATGTGPESGTRPEEFTDAEEMNLNATDNEALNNIDGYDFSGSDAFGERERKFGMRFIDAAINDIGGDDQEAVLRRAMTFAQDAIDDPETSEQMGAVYAETLRFLQESLTNVQARAAAGASGATGSGPESGTGATETDDERKARKEKEFFDTLDAEPLDTPAGYDPKDWGSLGMRERKQAVRFINEAKAAVDDPNDKVKVIEEALARAAAAQAGATGEYASLYANTLNVLNKSAERVRKDADKDTGPDLRSLLNDLGSETGRLKFTWLTNKKGRPAFDASGYDDLTQKLIVRVYNEAEKQTLADMGMPKAPDRPPSFSAGEADHDILDAQREIYNDFYGRLFRTMTTMAHTDKTAGFNANEQQMFLDAVKYAAQVRRSVAVARS